MGALETSGLRLVPPPRTALPQAPLGEPDPFARSSHGSPVTSTLRRAYPGPPSTEVRLEPIHELRREARVGAWPASPIHDQPALVVTRRGGLRFALRR